MLEDLIRTVKDFDKTEHNGELSSLIGQQAVREASINDKELHSLIHRYKNNEYALKVINETLISICGLSLETIISKANQGGKNGIQKLQ